jgi:hypothetical protein
LKAGLKAASWLSPKVKSKSSILLRADEVID